MSNADTRMSDSVSVSPLASLRVEYATAVLADATCPRISAVPYGPDVWCARASLCLRHAVCTTDAAAQSQSSRWPSIMCVRASRRASQQRTAHWRLTAAAVTQLCTTRVGRISQLCLATRRLWTRRSQASLRDFSNQKSHCANCRQFGEEMHFSWKPERLKDGGLSRGPYRLNP